MRKLSFLFIAFALVAFVSLTSCKSTPAEAPAETPAVEEAPAPAPVADTAAAMPAEETAPAE